MKQKQTIKSEILSRLIEIVTGKIKDAEFAIASARSSRDSDTKSSAGDKYETGRAMVQQEIDNNELQLSKALQQQLELHRLNTTKVYDKVEPGSLVITNHENYFISIALGKINISNNNYYAISLLSPIGMLLKHKCAGDKIDFLGRQLVIKDII